MFLLFFFTYFSVLVFLVVTIYKFIKIAKSTKNQKIVPDNLLPKGDMEHNHGLFPVSFPFRFAMHLLIGNMILLVMGTLIQITGISPFVFHANSFWASFWTVYRTIIDIIIWFGSILGMLGVIRLIITLIANKNKSQQSNPGYYFNIILIGAVYATSLIWRLNDFDMVRNLMGFYLVLLTFSPSIAMNLPINIPMVGYVHIIITLMLIICFPFTQKKLQ